MATLAEPATGADSLDQFRTEVRDWLAANFPASLKGKDNAMSAVEGPTNETPEQAAWRKDRKSVV